MQHSDVDAEKPMNTGQNGIYKQVNILLYEIKIQGKQGIYIPLIPLNAYKYIRAHAREECFRSRRQEMKESELEKRFCRLVVQAGGKAYKFLSPGNSGVPDRLVILPEGRIGFIELKRPGESPRKLQQFQLGELERLGCYTAVVDSLEQAEAVISELARMSPATHARDSLFLEMVNRTPGHRKGVVL